MTIPNSAITEKKVTEVNSPSPAVPKVRFVEVAEVSHQTLTETSQNEELSLHENVSMALNRPTTAAGARLTQRRPTTAAIPTGRLQAPPSSSSGARVNSLIVTLETSEISTATSIHRKNNNHNASILPNHNSEKKNSPFFDPTKPQLAPQSKSTYRKSSTSNKQSLHLAVTVMDGSIFTNNRNYPRNDNANSKNYPGHSTNEWHASKPISKKLIKTHHHHITTSTTYNHTSSTKSNTSDTKNPKQHPPTYFKPGDVKTHTVRNLDKGKLEQVIMGRVKTHQEMNNLTQAQINLFEKTSVHAKLTPTQYEKLFGKHVQTQQQALDVLKTQFISQNHHHRPKTSKANKMKKSLNLNAPASATIYNQEPKTTVEIYPELLIIMPESMQTARRGSKITISRYASNSQTNAVSKYS